jgi:hypothetical protein
MSKSSKHFFRTVKRLAKKALRKPTRKCKCTRRRSRRTHRRHTHRHYRSRGGGELTNGSSIYGPATTFVKTEDVEVPVLRTIDEIREEQPDVSYDADVDQPTNNNTKKLKNNFSPNMYNQPEIENAEL